MRWFTSDLHLGHTNILKFCDRPFVDVGHMNTAIVNAMNERVGSDDELWILGDVAMGNIDHTLPIVRQLTARRVVIVTGNHDRCHPYNKKKAIGWLERYERLTGAEIINGNTELTLADGTEVQVSHFPYSGNSYIAPPRERRPNEQAGEDRYAQWRPVDTGGWLLCGHVHNAWGIRGRQINVGVDIWKHPIPESLIEEIVNLKNEGWHSAKPRLNDLATTYPELAAQLVDPSIASAG